MDYQTVLSVLGIGIANVVALWRMNRDLKQDLKNDINNLRRDTKDDINSLRRDMKDATNGLRQDMKSNTSGLRQDMKSDINGLRQDMKDVQQRLSRVEAHLQHLTEPQHAS